MKIFDMMNRSDTKLKTFLNVFIYIFAAGLIFTVTLQVLDRYAYVPFRTIWTSEMARYIYIWVSVIGAAISLQENRHVKVDLVVDKLPFSLRKICEIMSVLIVIVVSVFLLYSLRDLMPRVARQTSSAARIPMSYVYSAAVLAGVTFIFFSITRLIRWFGYKNLDSIQQNDL